MQRVSATRLLLVFATIDIVLIVIAAFAPGSVAVAALTLTSFFMSIMFPTIFSLGVKDLGDRAMLGAPLIIMAIIGGALFPPLMGLASQAIGGVIQHTMLLPGLRSEEHTSELQSLMRISYAVFCLKKKKR